MGLSNRMVGDVNRVFIDLYERFDRGEDPVKVDREESGENGAFSIWNYGTMGFARIREALAAADLISARPSDKEQTYEDGRTKTRRLIRPSAQGFSAYRNGRLIGVPYPMDGPPKEIPVGVGIPYQTIDGLRKLYEEIIGQSGRRVPKYRREEWEAEFYGMIPDLSGQLRLEAETTVRRWIQSHLEECRFRRNTGAPRCNEYTESIRLSDQCLDKWMRGLK